MRVSGSLAANAAYRSGGTSAESTPSCCGHVEPSTPSLSARAFWPASRQNGPSYAATNLAAQACRWRRSEVSRSSLTP